MKSFYAYVRSKHRTRVGIGPLTNVQGKIIESNEEMGEILNDYFSSVFTKENKDSLPEIKSIE